MGSSHSTHTGAQGDLGQRVGQWAASANQGALQFAAGLHTAADTTAALHQGASHLAQAAGPAADTLRLAMANLQRAKLGGAYGGDDYGASYGGYFGGDDSADPAKGLREYEASLSAQAKEDVIRRLARALSRVGIAVNPEGDLDEIVRELVAQIPNPRTNKKTFSDEATAQEKICRLVADVLNDEFTPGETTPAAKFIDTSLSPVEVCRAVGEWAHNFAAGVNTEFLAVHASVRNALRNIEILAEVMREVYAKIRQKAERLGDAEFGREFDPLNEIFSRAQAERQRQEELLKNILHVHLAPAARELEIAMRDESEQNALIKRLGLKPGTSEFADSLAMAVSGLGTSASIAQRVHRALKQVGLSVREYLASPGYTELRRLLDAKVESGEVRADDLAKFLEAANILRLNFDDRQDARFREALDAAAATGGADEYKTAIDKRVEKAKTEKTVIVRDFVGRVARHYDELLAAVKALSLELGKKIPLTDKTDALRDALTRLRDMREARIELALVGLYSDAAARERKERFLSGLRLVSTTCVMLMELEMYRPAASLFARLKAAIDALEKTIDYFADVITQKFGGEDGEGEDEALDLYGGARRKKRARTHGGAGEDLLPEIARSALSLTEAVNEFAYFYYVAKVRANLEQSAAELEIFGEKYIELLGDAVAARLWHLRQARRAIEDRLTDAHRAAAAPGGGAGPLFGAFGAPGTAAVPNAAGDARFAAAKKWVEQEFAAKENFYKALQAMDLYMKAFTLGIVKDPDAIRDIKKMLDGTQVIARWFSEDTGNHLWRAFEHMWSVDFAGPARSTGAGARAAAQAVLGDADSARPHYYQKVAHILANSGPTLGVPQMGIPAGDDPAQPDHADLAKKSVASALDHYQAFKNLVNAFARIGDRFGGRELRTQIFMSPTQIFKILTDYMKQSAMSINAGGAAEPGPIATPISATPSQVLDRSGNIADGVGAYQVYFGSVLVGLAGNYEIEDRYFVMIIKAMAAKILTALGVYDMFERRTPKYDLTPTRLIVGGADEGEPEVVEGAAELYFRLPRLAEFYRHFLRWDGRAQQLKIAMLPELEGIFAGLIRLIFQKVASPQSGDYSDYELNALIREINQIYRHFHEKSGERAAQAALSAFVMEINRRYGIVKSEDMTKYWEFIRRARRDGEWGSFNNTNYAILPGEEEVEVDRRAPSDRYTLPGELPTPSAGLPREFTGRVLLDDDVGAAGSRRMLLRDFRADLEKAFDEARDGFGTISYSLLIKQAETEIRRAASEARLAVAHKLIQSTSVLGTDSSKSLMFHETVIVGLNTLGAIHSYLNAFSTQIDLLNPAIIADEIMDGLHAGLAGGAPLAGFSRDILLGVGYMNGAQHAPYIFTGVANQLNRADSRFLWMRGGMADTVRTGHVYQFWVLEANFARAHEGRLPAPPSTYTGKPEAVGSLTVPQQRCLRAMRLVARLLVDYQALMRDYVETIFALGSGSGGLVEVRFPQGDVTQVSVNFSKLRGVAEAILGDVKYYLDFFRPFIPKETLQRFEDIGSDGSVFWLEEHLVDKRFRGASDDPNDPSARETLDGLSRRANGAFLALVGDTEVPLSTKPDVQPVLVVNANSLIDANNDADRAAESILIPSADNAPSRFETYGLALSGLLWYDAGLPNSGIPSAPADLTGMPSVAAGGWDTTYTLGGLIATARAQAQGNRPAPPPGTGAGPAGRFLFYLDTGATTRYRSLLFSFNQLLARYLAVFTDPSGSRKIYANLIDAFANGVAARAVTTPQGQAFPDVAYAGQNFGRRGDPANGVVLFQSLAFVLQRLVKDANPATQVADHLVSTLTDVPLYVKESYRANLPGFVRLFDLLVQKGDFVKQLFQKTLIRCDRPDLLVISGADNVTKIRANVNLDDTTNLYPAGSLVALRVVDGPLSSDAMKARASEIIDSISTGAYTLSSRATDVLKELGDQPVYLQTQEGSIETYKARYGKVPLMPYSFALYFYGDLDFTDGYSNDLKLFPSGSYGEPRFKLQYGVRGLLVRQTPVEYATMPGVRALVDAYNGVSAQREQLDPGRYLEFLKNATAVLRYFTEARNYKSVVSPHAGLFSTEVLYARGGGAGFAVQLWDGTVGNSAYPLGKDGQVIVTAVESSNQEEETRKMTAVVGQAPGSSGGDKRAKERILNLVDMNIIPINVHALMRDVPLANLYNYEYTFEQMAAALYGESATHYLEGADGYVTDAKVRQSRQMFLRLLVNPYYNLNTNGFGDQLYGSDVLDLGSAGFVHRIFRGDSNLGLGRPKMLSDQLFNKALFGSTYVGRADYDEAGPGVGAGVARGRAAVGLRAQNLPQMRQFLVHAYEQLDATLQFLMATATAAAVGAEGVLDDGGAGDAAADRALNAVMDRAVSGINNVIADYTSAQAITGPIAGQSAALYALDFELRAQLAVAAGQGGVVQGTNLRGTLLDAGAGQDAQSRMVLDALRGRTQAGGAVFTIVRVSRQAQLFTGILGNAAHTVDVATRDAARLGLLPGDRLPAQRVNWAPVTGPRATHLSFLQAPAADARPETAVVELSVGATKGVLETIGRMRFDTRLVRNIFFITNVLRLVRLKLNRELTQSRSVLTSSHSAVAPGLTEYGSDPFGPNEVYASTLPNGYDRYDDRDQLP